VQFFQKKVLPPMATSASATIVASAMNYDIQSSSVIQILQDQVSQLIIIHIFFSIIN
jgi:hypothetical protein